MQVPLNAEDSCVRDFELKNCQFQRYLWYPNSPISKMFGTLMLTNPKQTLAIFALYPQHIFWFNEIHKQPPSPY